MRSCPAGSIRSSGQPASKRGAARVRRFAARWYGFAVSRRAPITDGLDYWALSRVAGGWRMELAGLAALENWREFGQALFGSRDAAARLVSYDDPASGVHRLAILRDGVVEAALFIAPKPLTISRAFVASGLAEGIDGLRLLAGRSGAGREDKGETVCACFQVGVNQIRKAISEGGSATVADVGAALKAGTNCGSCRPEIQKLLNAALPVTA